jgi:hypothetical protein
MVHALKEAWRVLRPQGIMIDVRPLSLDVPLEVLFEEGSEAAGVVDMSPCIDLDYASDGAIESVIGDGMYREIHKEQFDFAFYWKTIKGMQEDIKENWEGEVNITDEVWSKAIQIIEGRHSRSKIRLGMQMKLAVYVKLETA